MSASGPGNSCPRKPQRGLEEVLCPDRRRTAARLHHAICAIPVFPTGKPAVAMKTATVNKPGKLAANWDSPRLRYARFGSRKTHHNNVLGCQKTVKIYPKNRPLQVQKSRDVVRTWWVMSLVLQVHIGDPGQITSWAHTPSSLKAWGLGEWAWNW